MKALYLTLLKNIFWKLQSFLFHFKKLQPSREVIQSDSFSILNLNSSHSSELSILLKSASKQDFKYFTPHSFSVTSFDTLLTANHYKAWGLFINQKLVGYSFVRCTFPSKAYAGYFIHPNFRQQGFSKKLFQTLKTFSKLNNLKLFTTVSPKNIASLKASTGFSKIGIRKNGDWILEHDL